MSGTCNDCHNHPCVCGMDQAGSELSGGLGEAEFEVRCNGESVAWATGKRDEAKREAEHYAFIYGQDGPVEVFEVFKTYTRMDYTRW